MKKTIIELVNNPPPSAQGINSRDRLLAALRENTQAGAGVHGASIRKITNLPDSFLYPNLNELEKAGVLVSRNDTVENEFGVYQVKRYYRSNNWPKIEPRFKTLERLVGPKLPMRSEDVPAHLRDSKQRGNPQGNPREARLKAAKTAVKSTPTTRVAQSTQQTKPPINPTQNMSPARQAPAPAPQAPQNWAPDGKNSIEYARELLRGNGQEAGSVPAGEELMQAISADLLEQWKGPAPYRIENGQISVSLHDEIESPEEESARLKSGAPSPLQRQRQALVDFQREAAVNLIDIAMTRAHAEELAGLLRGTLMTARNIGRIDGILQERKQNKVATQELQTTVNRSYATEETLLRLLPRHSVSRERIAAKFTRPQLLQRFREQLAQHYSLNCTERESQELNTIVRNLPTRAVHGDEQLRLLRWHGANIWALVTADMSGELCLSGATTPALWAGRVSP